MNEAVINKQLLLPSPNLHHTAVFIAAARSGQRQDCRQTDGQRDRQVGQFVHTARLTSLPASYTVLYLGLPFVAV